MRIRLNSRTKLSGTNLMTGSWMMGRVLTAAGVAGPTANISVITRYQREISGNKIKFIEFTQYTL